MYKKWYIFVDIVNTMYYNKLIKTLPFSGIIKRHEFIEEERFL